MPRTLKKDIIRLIRATKGRFLSLTAIVTIGVAFFVGVSASSTIMADNVDAYSDRLRLKDITVYSNYGFDEDDIRAIGASEHAEYAEGSKFVDVMASAESVTLVTRVHSYDPSSAVNLFDLREGRLPGNRWEVLCEAGTDLEPGYPLGTVVRLRRPDDDLEDWLNVDTVTVVGRIDTPLYLNETKENSTLSNQYLQTYLYIPEDAFTIDYDLEVNVLIRDGASYESFYDAYEKYSGSVRDEIEELGTKQQSHRRDIVLKEAYEKLADGKKEYEDGVREFNEKIADAEKEIADAEKEIADGEKEIADGIKKLEDGQKELDEKELDAYQQIYDARAQIELGREKLKAGEEEFAEKVKEYTELKKQLQDGLDQIDDGVDKLTQARDGLAQIDEGLAQIDAGISGLEEARDGLAQIDEMLEIIDAVLPALKEESETLETLRSEIIEALEEDGAGDLTIDEVTGGSGILDEALEELGLDSENTVSDLLDTVTDRLRNEEISGEDLDRWESVVNSLMEEAELDEAVKEELAQRSGEIFDRAREDLGQINELKEQLNISDTSIAGITSWMEETRAELIKQKEDILRQLEEGGVDPENIQASIDALEAQRTSLLETKAGIEAGLEEQGIDPAGIDAKITELNGQKPELEDMIRQIDEGIEEGKRTIEDARRELDNAYAATINAAAELAEEVEKAQKEINDGWREIEENRIKLRDGKKELEDGKKELEDARRDGLQELADARSELDKAEQDIADLEEGKWTVLDRSSHYASRTYKNTVEQMAAIARIFPVFFALVAALVCLTTMTRMVDEQRGQIGIMRALGYTEMQCAAKYLIYAGTAALVGEVLGSVLGLLIFPIIIYTAWRMMYVLPPMRIYVPWGMILLASVSFLAVMLGTTWTVCRRDMKDVPSQLLRPKPPKLGKNMLMERITFLWNRLSFTWKVTMRNLFRYKRRFVMTVVGVAGCTALLITGFGVSDSINSMVDIQFSEIQLYDGMLKTKGLRQSEVTRFAEELERREDIESTAVAGSYTAIGKVPKQTLEETITVLVFSDPSVLEACTDLRTREKGIPLRLDDEGAIINEKLAENLSLKVGDTFEMESDTGVRRLIRVAGITEMYIQHYAFMTNAYYSSVFSQPLREDTILVTVNGDDEVSRAFQLEITADERVSELHFYDAILENFRGMVNSLDLIVWVLIISSMSLAFVVLGNLMNINISERQREIATLKVLGFRRREVESYIYKENNILTIVGALAGMPVGQILHHFIMRQVEMDYIMFGRRVALTSNILSVFMTIGFGLLVNLFMRKRLRQIEMVESLKSVE